MAFSRLLREQKLQRRKESGRRPLSPLALQNTQDSLFLCTRDTKRDNTELVLSLQSLQVCAFDIGVGLNQIARRILQRCDQI